MRKRRFIHKFGVLECSSKMDFLILLVLVICGSSAVEGYYVHKAPHGDQLPVQKCRLMCESSFLEAQQTRCEASSGCSMCWDYCSMLFLESRTIMTLMCTDVICFSGCRNACKFYGLDPKRQHESRQKLLEKLTKP